MMLPPVPAVASLGQPLACPPANACTRPRVVWGALLLLLLLLDFEHATRGQPDAH